MPSGAKRSTCRVGCLTPFLVRLPSQSAQLRLQSVREPAKGLDGSTLAKMLSVIPDLQAEGRDLREACGVSDAGCESRLFGRYHNKDCLTYVIICSLTFYFEPSNTMALLRVRYDTQEKYTVRISTLATAASLALALTGSAVAQGAPGGNGSGGNVTGGSTTGSSRSEPGNVPGNATGSGAGGTMGTGGGSAGAGGSMGVGSVSQGASDVSGVGKGNAGAQTGSNTSGGASGAGGR